MLDDGFSTVIQFSALPTVKFKEKTVQPPGIDGGDKIPTTTMFNTLWSTFAARQLQELTDASTTVAYDPDVYSDAQITTALLNVEQTVTIHFPDGSTLAFFGYLKSFIPQSHEEGTQPEADIVIVPTNRDTASPYGEEGPAMTEVSGT